MFCESYCNGGTWRRKSGCAHTISTYGAHSTQRCLVVAENIHFFSRNHLRDAIVGLDHAPGCGSDQVVRCRLQAQGGTGATTVTTGTRFVGPIRWAPSLCRQRFALRFPGPLLLASHQWFLFRRPRFRHCPSRSAPHNSWPVASHSDPSCSLRWTARTYAPSTEVV